MQQEIDLAWRDICLAGTLHLPASSPPHPAVLMLQGSGPADRDSDGYFPPIRRAFLSRGIAVFSFDKPGIGGWPGEWRHYALADRADQALSATTFLRPRRDQSRLDRSLGGKARAAGSYRYLRPGVATISQRSRASCCGRPARSPGTGLG